MNKLPASLGFLVTLTYISINTFCNVLLLCYAINHSLISLIPSLFARLENSKNEISKLQAELGRKVICTNVSLAWRGGVVQTKGIKRKGF